MKKSLLALTVSVLFSCVSAAEGQITARSGSPLTSAPAATRPQNTIEIAFVTQVYRFACVSKAEEMRREEAKNERGLVLLKEAFTGAMSKVEKIETEEEVAKRLNHVSRKLSELQKRDVTTESTDVQKYHAQELFLTQKLEGALRHKDEQLSFLNGFEVV